MDNEAIDRAIFAETDTDFRKVALIVARVANSLNLQEEWVQKQIAKRIRTLIRKEVLEVVGNPFNWRASEVRRKPSALER